MAFRFKRRSDLQSKASTAASKLLMFPRRNLNITGDGSRIRHPLASESARPLFSFSHLRWNFVFQRPQHLLSRFARLHPIYFVEEPIFEERASRLEIKADKSGVFVVLPRVSARFRSDPSAEIRKLLEDGIPSIASGEAIFWYYTPMALEFSRSWHAALTVYDCMDELSHFAGADPRLVEYERELFRRADLVFTGGRSLYEAKRSHHGSVHAMPSSIEREHFAKALEPLPEPHDQAAIRGPKVGYFGVLDERFDAELIARTAELRPDFNFVFLGPVVKIDPASLPHAPNIFYLGQKEYSELPNYLAHWDVAIMPFARNDATRFISPTKTPEYLAGGRPVVSTPIRDVVSPYGDQGLVHIADRPEEFAEAIDRARKQTADGEWRRKVGVFLSKLSWDTTVDSMHKLMTEVLLGKTASGTYALEMDSFPAR